MTETLDEYCKRTEQEKTELSTKIAQMECQTFHLEIEIAGLKKEITAQKFTIDAQAAVIKEWQQDEKERADMRDEMCEDGPSPEELIKAEADAYRVTEAFRSGRVTYEESARALGEAQHMRALILKWYRKKAKGK